MISAGRFVKYGVTSLRERTLATFHDRFDSVIQIDRRILLYFDPSYNERRVQSRRNESATKNIQIGVQARTDYYVVIKTFQPAKPRSHPNLQRALDFELKLLFPIKVLAVGAMAANISPLASSSASTYPLYLTPGGSHPRYLALPKISQYPLRSNNQPPSPEVRQTDFKDYDETWELTSSLVSIPTLPTLSSTS
jgi:hypothetical protein